MLKKIVSIYIMPLLTSTVVAMAILALRVSQNPIEISLILLGAFISVFVLDLDYFLYAYFIETDSDFSRNLRAYFSHRDFSGGLAYLASHKDYIEDKALNSAIFQIALALLSIFLAFSNTNIFLKTIVYSTFANSIYRSIESYIEFGPKYWFWSIKNKPSREIFVIYLIFMILVLFGALYFI